VVVQGSYPEELLASWDEYASLKKSENERPSRFSDKQTFCIIELSYHGQDLESHSVSTWTEAAHIFWSVVRTLSRGEQECQFEHRDLHWGNVLIDQSEEDEMLERLLDNLNLEDDGKNMLDGSWGEVKVTLIDYTLSRARVDDLAGSVAHYGFQDEAIFEGKRNSPLESMSLTGFQETTNSRFTGKCAPSLPMKTERIGRITSPPQMSFGYITSPTSYYMANNFRLP
jgi:Haspin like kinase domain